MNRALCCSLLIIVGLVCEKREVMAQAPLGIQDQAHAQTFLEDFYDDDYNATVVNANEEHREMACTVSNSTHGLSVEEFYKKTIANLKKKYPKLTKLRLRGGYIYKPANHSSSDALKAELEHLGQTIKAIDGAVNAQGIRLRRLVLTAVLVFEKTDSLNVTDLLTKELDMDGNVNEFDGKSWSVPFKIRHGRGVLKVNLSQEEKFAEKPEGRSRYYPTDALSHHMGPGPMLGSASYDPERNVTKIWSPAKGNVELQGNHMDSEELEEYFPRNFHGE